MGATTGILVGTKFPVAFTLVYSLQWFAHGSIYYGEEICPRGSWIVVNQSVCGGGWGREWETSVHSFPPVFQMDTVCESPMSSVAYSTDEDVSIETELMKSLCSPSFKFPE